MSLHNNNCFGLFGATMSRVRVSDVSNWNMIDIKVRYVR